MKIFLRRMCLGALLAFPLLLMAASQERMLGDLDSIRNAFKVLYAPAEWKNKFLGWDLDTEIEKAKANVIASSGKMTTKDFQILVKNFLNSTRDYHVSVVFYSSEKASLPFRVKGAGGKYFISYINRKRLSLKSFPFSVGDELLLFDGRPVDEVIKELMCGETTSNEQTDKALAEGYLTHRSGMLGHIVPKGTTTITVLPTGASKPSSFQLIWNYKPEKVPQPPKPKALPTLNPLSKSLRKPKDKKKEILKDPIFQKLLLVPHFNHLMSENEEDEEEEQEEPEIIGSRNSFIPILGRIWWETSENCPFNAYLFELEDRKLAGYVRIPSYMPSSFNDIEEFEKIIAFMEERSDALVIDQVDNPGGSVFYLYAMAAMLTDQALSTPKHRMSITQADVYVATTMIPFFESIHSNSEARMFLGESLLGTPVTHQLSQFMLNFFRFIVEEWNAGRQFTEPYFLYGIDHINPNLGVHYTKPILVLINSLDFSGGDFFAAILQDNHRATLMGSRTAGAGGFLSRFKFPNLNGIAEVRFTGSIAERSDKSPIENLGVIPDIPYEITENDLRHNYTEYAEAICNALSELLGKEEKEID